MIKLVKVKDRGEGNLRAHNILKSIVDKETLLALSGGTSPDYSKMIVDPADILPGAICVVDERYGKPFHVDSNELLLKNAGVIDYCQRKGIDFYKILEGKGIEATAEDYNQLMSELFVKFPKKVGVMGIGSNLHTAGIFPYSAAAKAPHYVVSEEVEDKFPLRVTLTLRALGEFQTFVILAFGEEKREAVKIMLDENENDMQACPAIFYRKCFAKSFLITDINLKYSSSDSEKLP